MSALCGCGIVRERHISGPQAKFPGKPFFVCDGPNGCGAFDWADETPHSLISQEVGPNCSCGKASVQRRVKKEGPSKGRKFWGCASYPHGCRFFEWQSDGEGSSNAPKPSAPVTPSPQKRPALPGFASYLTDWRKVQIIQNMMAVDTENLYQSSFNYDKLDVVGVWHISNPSRMEKYQEAMSRERLKLCSGVGSYAVRLPGSYTTAMNELGMESLDCRSNEVFLLHGTNPTSLYSILFEGLDPAFASNGNFGRGVYFADNAAKIDQYAVEDSRYDKEGPLSELHERIYGANRHPTRVRYALVCRVLLGTYITTMDGKTQLASEKNGQDDEERPLFMDSSRRALAPFPNGSVPSSLIAEPGVKVQSFREFVVFNPDQIFVEYLVAYQRVQSLCACRIPVTERTVSADTPNRGRKIHLCGEIQKGGDKKCDFIQMFPLCDCGQSASIQTSHSNKNPGRRYYSCCKKGGNRRRRGWMEFCDYFSWVDNTATSAGSPHKKQRIAPGNGGDSLL